MGIDISRSQVLKHQFLEGSLWHEVAEVNHDGHVCQLSRLHGAIHRIPLRPLVVSCFDPYHNLSVFPDTHGSELRVHVTQVLLDRSASHA